MEPIKALLIVSCQIFQLQASLQAPQLTVTPRSPYYVMGQSVTLTCSQSGNGKGKRFTFFKDKIELSSSEWTWNQRESYHIPQLHISHSGAYSYTYCTISDKQPIHSLESDPAWITVLDPPPRPVLKLNPPTGEVNEGNRLLITCSTNRNSTEKRFHFYRDGVEMTPANEGLLWLSREPGGASTDASVTILQARPSQTGDLTCSYEEKNSSRWISSPWSQKVNITVWAQHPYSALEHARWAIPLLIAMVPLIFCCRERVSFQILHVQTTSEAPELTVIPKGLYYTTGQSVTLTCRQSGNRRPERFTFFKDRTELASLGWSWRTQSDRYDIPQLKVSDTGEYSCKYWTWTSPRSLESSPVLINVLEPPHPPHFSVSPKRDVYRSGESISLTCSIPNNRHVSEVLFYKNRQQQRALVQSQSSPENFTQSLTLFPQDGGEYSCKYWVKSEWEIPSPESISINISVLDPPPRPALKVDPPSREVNEGDQLLITCSTNRNDTEKRFHFYRDSIEMTPAHEGLLWSSREPGNASADASVTILQVKANHTGGEFACRYEEKMSSHWVSSPWSQKVNIT
ncbi:UNVERIFIED_CONTAM: hypothetical protein K2H54_042684, partial [Gekko kuhli]